MYQFIHSPNEGHPGHFQVLAIINKAVIDIFVQVFVLCEHKFSTSFGEV
jgi:hypothetical protein